jgi:hypothetical protein
MAYEPLASRPWRGTHAAADPYLDQGVREEVAADLIGGWVSGEQWLSATCCMIHWRIMVVG